MIIQTHFSLTLDLRAPAELVWTVLTDVPRWSDWTASVSRVKPLTAGPLRVGSRVRIHQPKLLPASWRVTELKPGKHFAWVSTAPGVLVTARHVVQPATLGCSVTLSVTYKGILGRLLARWAGELNDHYLALEGNGLRNRCQQFATKAELPTT